jgi:hypothetical protein
MRLHHEVNMDDELGRRPGRETGAVMAALADARPADRCGQDSDEPEGLPATGDDGRGPDADPNRAVYC